MSLFPRPLLRNTVTVWSLERPCVEVIENIFRKERKRKKGRKKKREREKGKKEKKEKEKEEGIREGGRNEGRKEERERERKPRKTILPKIPVPVVLMVENMGLEQP